MSELELHKVGYRVYQCGAKTYMVRLPNRNLIAADFPSIEMGWHIAGMHYSKKLRDVQVFRFVGGKPYTQIAQEAGK